MPYYLTRVAELPYPHTMGERPLPDGTRSNCPLALEAVLRTRGQHPGQDGYRDLFTDDAISERRRACDVHAGNWTVVLPAVTAFLEPFPASADTAAIAHAARNHAPFADLAAADRRLALALLSYSDSLRVYTNGHGQRETIGQHRICWARTAGVCALPVWFDATTVRPPRGAVLLQRGESALSVALPARPARRCDTARQGYATAVQATLARHPRTPLGPRQDHHSVG